MSRGANLTVLRSSHHCEPRVERHPWTTTNGEPYEEAMSDFGRFAVDGRERRLYTTFHVGPPPGILCWA